MSKSKILSIVVLVLGLIGVFLFVRILMAEDGSASQSSASDAMVMYGYYLLIITAIVALVASIVGLISNPQSLKLFLRNIIILGVLLVISYLLASDGEVRDAMGKVLKGGEAGSATSKWVSTLINFAGFLFLGGILAIGMGFVQKLIKR